MKPKRKNKSSVDSDEDKDDMLLRLAASQLKGKVR